MHSKGQRENAMIAPVRFKNNLKLTTLSLCEICELKVSIFLFPISAIILVYGDVPFQFNQKAISKHQVTSLFKHHHLFPLSPTTSTAMAATATTTDASPKFQQNPEFYQEVSVSPTSHDGLQFWQFMIAGSIAGTVEHVAMFPVDTLKTRMQAIGSSCPSAMVSLRQSLGSILKLEGAAGLYRGIAAMGLGAGPAHAVYFSVYERCKKVLSAGNPNNSAAHAASGVFATVASDAVITPMDMVKQRLQLKSSPYKGVGDCVRKVLVEEGIGAFYASYRTTVVMNAPFTAVHFATYEAAKRGLMEVSPESVRDDETVVVHATAGAVAGALAAAVTTPLDVVKTQLQCQGVCGCDRFSSSSIQDVIRSVVKKDGYGGLIRGWIPRMLFHAPAAAICWSTYEAAKTFFQGLNASNNSTD